MSVSALPSIVNKAKKADQEIYSSCPLLLFLTAPGSFSISWKILLANAAIVNIIKAGPKISPNICNTVLKLKKTSTLRRLAVIDRVKHLSDTALRA